MYPYDERKGLIIRCDERSRFVVRICNDARLRRRVVDGIWYT